MNGEGAGIGTVLRRLIGWVIALAGIIFALAVGGFSAIIMLGYWSYEGTEGRTVLTLTVLLSLLMGYGIYWLGRRVAG